MKFPYKIPGVKFLTKNIPTSEGIEMYLKYDQLLDEDQEALDNYLKLIKPELEKYPSNFFKKVGLKRIAFVKNLLNHNEISDSHDNVYASTDTDTKLLLIDFFVGKEYPKYQLKCFHHELFHLIEINLHGTYTYQDKVWIGLNSPGFKYGKGGKVAYTMDKWENLKHPKEGFVTTYATLGIDEDRAETFAYIMTDHLQENLNKYMKEDKILRNKVKYLKEFITNLNS